MAFPVSADDAYEFLTLYSPERQAAAEPAIRAAPNGPIGDPAVSSRLTDSDARASDGRIVDWRRQLPWWREKALDRGPLAPFDRESAFERSLESGRAYWERRDRAQPAARAGGAPQLPYGDDGSQILRPVVAAVRWREDAETALPRPGPRDTHRGVTLVGSTYGDAGNREFFRTAKAAIDLVETLPDGLREFARQIRRIVYDPPSPRRRAAGALGDMDAVYAITDIGEKAPLVLYRDTGESSAVQTVLSLVGGGVLAARHSRLIALRDVEKRIEEGTAPLSDEEVRALRREIADRRMPVGGTAEGRINAAECELQAVLHAADKALGRSQRAISARLKAMYRRGC